MAAHRICAIVENDVVVRLLVGSRHECTNIAKASYLPGSYAIEVTDYSVKLGDKCLNERFYRDGEEIKKNPTEKEEIETLRRRLSDITSETNKLIVDVAVGLIDVIEEVDK